MDSIVTFYVARHGETLLNFINKAQGWVDSPLTEKGMHTAKQLGQKLNSIHFSAAYSSDTSRAILTAKTILTAKGQKDLPIVPDNRLREWCLGCWEAENNDKFISSVMNAFPKQYNFTELNLHLPEVCDFIYRADTTGMAEPFHIITKRLEDFFIEAGNNHLTLNSSNVLIITHAFAIKTLLYLFSKEMFQKTSKNKIQNVDIFHIKWNGKCFFVE